MENERRNAGRVGGHGSLRAQQSFFQGLFFALATGYARDNTLSVPAAHEHASTRTRAVLSAFPEPGVGPAAWAMRDLSHQQTGAKMLNKY